MPLSDKDQGQGVVWVLPSLLCAMAISRMAWKPAVNLSMYKGQLREENDGLNVKKIGQKTMVALK